MGLDRAAADRGFRGWRLAWVLGATTIVSYGTTQYLFGVLVVPIGRDTGWSRAALSAAFSIAFLVAGALGVPVGRHVDRHGARAVMTVGSLAGAASLFGLSRAGAQWQFVGLWAVGIGVAQALTFYPVTFTVITNWFVRRRGAALAVLTLVGGLASVIFYPLAGVLVAAFGWRSALVVMAALQLGICVPLHLGFLRRNPEDEGQQPDGDLVPAAGTAVPDPGPTLGTAVRTRAFWTLTLCAGLILMAHSVILVHLVPYLIASRFDPVFAASLAGLLGVASLPARLVLNLLADRLGARLLLGLSIALQAVGTIVLIGTPARAGLVWVYVAVYGFAFGASSPLRAAVMGDQFGRRAYGGITALQGVAVALMAAAGPVAAGWLYERAGDYRLALWLTAGTFILGAVALSLTPPPAVPAWPPEPSRVDA